MGVLHQEKYIQVLILVLGTHLSYVEQFLILVLEVSLPYIKQSVDLSIII